MMRMVFLYIVVGLVGLFVGVAAETPPQTLTSSPLILTPIPVASLFEEDTCTPPCWFGLIPGQTTSQEIIALLEAYPDVFAREENFSNGTFYPISEYLIEGYYSFYLRHGTPNSVFIIQNGVLDWMRIMMSNTISLQQTLKNFGVPDYVRITATIDYYITLFYTDLNVIVSLSADSLSCQMPTILEDYTVEALYYYATENLNEFEKELNLDQWITIPDDTWSMWLEGKPEGTCGEAIGQVVRMSDLVTMTTVPLATSSPLILTPTTVTSLFAEDTCAPPCWFGLIPGQTTSQEIIALLDIHPEVFVREEDFANGTFYADSEYLIDGYYSFYLRGGTPNSVFVVQDGVLDWMRVMISDSTSLLDTITTLGQPAYIRAAISIYDLRLTLFYPELNIVVALVAERSTCQLSEILGEFKVDYLFYYSLDGFTALESSQHLNEDILVPNEVWNTWLSQPSAGSCEDTIAELFEPSDNSPTQATPPTPSPITSLFKDDTCLPPCWFGLLPGESTIDEIQSMFDTNQTIFSVRPRDYENLREGNSFSFIWRQWSRNDLFITNNSIEVRDGKLGAILLVMNEFKNLGDTLVALGYPTDVSVGGGLYQEVFMTLIYPSLNVVVGFSTGENWFDYPMMDILNDFAVDGVSYYPPGDLENYAQNPYISSGFYVPEKKWTTWFTGEIESTYQEVMIEFINSPYAKPSSPTPSPSWRRGAEAAGFLSPSP